MVVDSGSSQSSFTEGLRSARTVAVNDGNRRGARPLPWPLSIIRKFLFKLFICAILLGTAGYLFAEYLAIHPDDHESWHAWRDKLKYASIPVVSVAFTWWHVWLGIQMCWYPIKFVGIPPVLGWQGIVPRRANIMAERACDLMIGNLVTIEEVIDRVEPEDFFNRLGPALGGCCTAVLDTLATRHCPRVWEMLPENAKKELSDRVYEESQNMFKPVITDLKQNINQILNIKDMAVEALTSDRPLLVKMFQEIGDREFRFVLHVAAVMGFILGCLQMALWAHFHAWWSLPVSGLIIGYFTNWLAITMIFRPVHPHLMCGGYINFQGVFLKRQAEVAVKLSAMISTHLLYARRMLEYVIRTEGFAQVLQIYQTHLDRAIDEVIGRASFMVPIFIGPQAVESMKKEVVEVTIEELPKHSQEIEEYMDRTFGLNDILGPRLAALPPEDFEGMLHPVFQEDEWMVLLLGGILGVVVGSVQAFVLGG